MFRVNNKDTKTTWRRFGVFLVNSEHISHFCSSVSIVNFEPAGYWHFKNGGGLKKNLNFYILQFSFLLQALLLFTWEYPNTSYTNLVHIFPSEMDSVL